MNTEDLILQQLTELKSDMSEARQFGARMLEATVKAHENVIELRRELLGNGQPGRIQQLETGQRYMLDRLTKHQSYIDGETGKLAVLGKALHYILTAAIAFVAAIYAKLRMGI